MRRVANSVRFPLISVQAKTPLRCSASIACFSSSIRRPPVTSATAVAAAQAANPQPALSPTLSVPSSPLIDPSATTAATTAAAAAVDTAAAAAHTVALKAYYVARGIDIHRIQGKVYKPYNLARREYQAKSVTITLNKELNQYISVFKYGSIVFFNIPEEHHTQHINRISEEAGFELIPETQQHTEMYKIVINPQLTTPSVLKAEHLNILSLDTNNLTIASTVMAQSVALDFYAMTVDRMLESFMQMNLKIQSTGNFNQLNNAELYKMIASNHSVMTNVLLKMGIFEGTDAAWDNADYYTTWEGLRKDFEIDFRYKDLSLKLDIVKDDARFFLEVLHNQKSTKMELIIIALIAGEMVIGLLSLAQGAV